MARKILEADTPGQHKALGRKVKGFDEDTWVANRRAVLHRGLRAKFSQNPRLEQLLCATAPSRLAEASPKDTIYGIGLAPGDPSVQDPTQWQGLNILGLELQRVRAELLTAGN